MAAKQEEAVSGKFQYLIFSPNGSVEGVLLEVEREPTQIVFDRRDGASSLDFETLKQGQNLIVRAKRQGPSLKGQSKHPVLGYIRLVSIDGRKTVKRRAAKGAAFTGVVTRFNYARHGEPNGVVLDNGDFIHTKPHGLARLKLQVGDKVSADGEARPLKVGGGRVVEATRVNGKRVKA